ncbi:MAG: manganese efflux pump MntP family protein [Siculibacillus sp.]
MSLLSLMILAFGLSIDAFAASIGRGAAVATPHLGVALRSAAVFGLTEMLMPVIGWGLGTAFSGHVESIDHWIAFALLMAVGGHMAWHAFQRDEDEAPPPRGAFGLVLTAIGTSIDSMAVGISLALLDVDILIAAPMIGFATFTMTTIGMMAGKHIGEAFGHRAEMVAGIGLALIGCGILYTHTMG